MLAKELRSLNIRDMVIWNRAALIKLLWAIELKKDQLWVRWIHHLHYERELHFLVPVVIEDLVDAQENY